MRKSSIVSAAEANRSFSKIFRRAADGETITITDRGKPVAVLSPAPASQNPPPEEVERRMTLLDEIAATAQARGPLRLGSFKREWAYDD
ncbi:MAG: type II toxin-antitoxin system Phd/YefM family antitoxin [Labrys sp. (in: a-proteobacteria)]